MKNATTKDRNLVIDILTHEFDANQSVNYIVKQDSGRAGRIRALMAYSYKICTMFGDVFLSDDQSACALIQYPRIGRVTAVIVEITVSAPRNIMVQIAGPERMGLDELVRIFLDETDDSRERIIDTCPRYLGATIDDGSFLPGESARIGKIRFIDWLGKQQK